MTNNKTILVAHREFIDNVKTKGFWIGILIFPILLTAMIIVPQLLEKTRSARQFAVIDQSGWVLDAVREGMIEDTARFVLAREATPEDESELNGLVGREELFAYFVIPPAPETSPAGARYVARNLADDALEDWFSGLVNTVVQERRLAQANLDPVLVRWVQEPVRFEARKIGASGEAEEVSLNDRIRQMAPVGFVYLLWVGVFIIAQMLLTNTVEEKSNRIIEVLLSSVSPVQLMAGKIMGVAWTGAAMLGAWLLSFFLVTKYVPAMLGAPASLDLSFILQDPLYLASFAVYFVLGYLLFAAILVSIGASVNTLKEAQNLMGPVTILLIVPLMAMMPIAQDPNGALAKILSWIPPFTPFVMMNRAAGPPTLVEYLGTTALLLVSIAVALWVAAKVFRVGILMTGKAPTPREILRWIRAPVGSVPGRR
ncbi:MAG: ABC transporter permease [Gemmatimonadales bacterium]